MRSTTIALGIVAFTLAASVGMCHGAKAGEFVTVRIVRDVPTVAGIRSQAAPHEFYRVGAPVVAVRPRAAILASPDANGAPPNGCDRPAFEVVSGPHARRGCYGGP